MLPTWSYPQQHGVQSMWPAQNYTSSTGNGQFYGQMSTNSRNFYPESSNNTCYPEPFILSEVLSSRKSGDSVLHLEGSSLGRRRRWLGLNRVKIIPSQVKPILFLAIAVFSLFVLLPIGHTLYNNNNNTSKGKNIAGPETVKPKILPIPNQIDGPTLIIKKRNIENIPEAGAGAQKNYQNDGKIDPIIFSIDEDAETFIEVLKF